MHKLTKITPFIRKEIWRKYKEKMRETKWKWKEDCYSDLWEYYRVHINTIRKIIKRARIWDFTVHLSTTYDNLWHWFKKYLKKEKKLLKRLAREALIERYEKEKAWELAHIDLHKVKTIKWHPPKKKKYLAWIIDDATRIEYSEVLPNKKAKTLAHFLKRAYMWFKKQWITIKKLMSDNGLEFTTHHVSARPKHSFEIMMKSLNIKHSYTKVRRPQTNGKIERFWRIFEEQFFQLHFFESMKEFNIKLKKWLYEYNNKRKHWGLWGLTPKEKLKLCFENDNVCI